MVCSVLQIYIIQILWDNTMHSSNHEETTWRQGEKNAITLWSQHLPSIGGSKPLGSCYIYVHESSRPNYVYLHSLALIERQGTSYTQISYTYQIKRRQQRKKTYSSYLYSHPLKLYTTNPKEELKVAEMKLCKTSYKEALLLKRSSLGPHRRRFALLFPSLLAMLFSLMSFMLYYFSYKG